MRIFFRDTFPLIDLPVFWRITRFLVNNTFFGHHSKMPKIRPPPYITALTLILCQFVHFLHLSICITLPVQYKCKCRNTFSNVQRRLSLEK